MPGRDTAPTSLPTATGLAVAEADATSPAHVLVVDDNVVNQKIAARFLEKLGYRPDVAANAAEAVAAVATTYYDAVLLDCQLPEVDGHAATSAIKALEADRSIPVITMRTRPTSCERERCLAAGADDVLAKPVRLDALAAMLARWLGPGGEGPVPQPATEGPAMDEEAIAQIRDADPAGFDEVVQLFVAHGEANLAGLRRATDAEDPFEVWDLTAALGGSSATIGARRVADLCAELEDAVGEWHRARALVELVEEAFASARAALTDALGRDHRRRG